MRHTEKRSLTARQEPPKLEWKLQCQLFPSLVCFFQRSAIQQALLSRMSRKGGVAPSRTWWEDSLVAPVLPGHLPERAFIWKPMAITGSVIIFTLDHFGHSIWFCFPLGICLLISFFVLVSFLQWQLEGIGFSSFMASPSVASRDWHTYIVHRSCCKGQSYILRFSYYA